MNSIDALIFVATIFAMVRGARLGLLYVFFSITGTLLGLLAGSWLGQIVAQYSYTELSRMLIIIGFSAGGAITVSEIGIRIAKQLTQKSADLSLDKINAVGGAILEFIFILITFWIATPALTNIQSANVGKQVRESRFLALIDMRLGAPPDVFAQIGTTISPNGFPNVFAFNEPALTTPTTPKDIDPLVIQKASLSVLKVEGRGCGGIVDGTGWVAGDGVVVTNAHVVSGISSPTVIYEGRAKTATPVLFDPNLDLAILRVPGLSLPALPLHESLLPNNANGAIIGFPGGGNKTANASVVIDHVIAAGRNIYNRGRVERQIYEIAADVQQGDSGGPLIDEQGAVAGIVFAKSISQEGIGYAITMPQALSSIRDGQNRTATVSTGRCSSE